MDIKINIDPRIETLMPKLTEAELSELEKSILADGCLNPLVVWEEGLLDGHQRFRICKRHGIPYGVKKLSFDSISEAMTWVMRQHVGRRNLDGNQSAYFIGKIYEAQKQSNGGDRRSKTAKAKSRGVDTATLVAAQNNISKTTVKRNEKLAEAIDSMAETHGDWVRPLLLSQNVGKLAPSTKDIRDMGRLDSEIQSAILSELRDAPTKDERHQPKSASALIKQIKRRFYSQRNKPNLTTEQTLSFDSSMRLIHGDAREKLGCLDADSIDCAVVDPPWAISNKRAYGGDAQIANDDPSEAVALLKEACHELERVCKADAHLYFIVGTQTYGLLRSVIEETFDVVSTLVWHKGTPSLVDFDMKYAPTYAFIIFAKQKGAKQRPLNGSQLSDVLFAKRLADASDTCEKPVALLEQLVSNSTQEGQVVLDFCMGSGSCGEAAMRLGRRFVGIEIDSKTYADAVHRLTNLWAKTNGSVHVPSAEDVQAVQRIQLGDAKERIQRLEDESVELVLTSPPYYNAEGYFDGLFKDYGEFKELLQTLAVETKRVLRNGRIAVVNVSDVLVGKKGGRKRKYPIVADVTKAFLDVGFDYREQIVWRKPSNVACRNTRSGNFIQYGQFPMYHFNDSIQEIVLVFQKGRHDYSSISDDIKAMSRVDLDRYMSEGWNLDVWDIDPIYGNGFDGGYAAFPLELAHRLISLYSHVGETVLDPFMGTGTTALACAQLHRNSIGFEIDHERFPIIERKVNAEEYGGVLVFEGLEEPLAETA